LTIECDNLYIIFSVRFSIAIIIIVVRIVIFFNIKLTNYCLLLCTIAEIHRMLMRILNELRYIQTVTDTFCLFVRSLL